jgi:hypothetical protein
MQLFAFPGICTTAYSEGFLEFPQVAKGTGKQIQFPDGMDALETPLKLFAHDFSPRTKNDC